MTTKQPSDNPVTEDHKPVTDGNDLVTAMQDVTADMPPISDHVVNQPQPEAKGDPAAELKKSNRGRKRLPDDQLKQPRRNQPQSKVAGQPTKPQAVDPIMEKATTTMTSLVQLSGVGLAGEAGVMSDTQRMVITECWRDYFNAKGVIDVPPGIALALGLSSYYVPLIAAPKTKTRIELLSAWIKNKIAGMRAKRYAAYSNDRNDDVGKNESGEKVRKTV